VFCEFELYCSPYFSWLDQNRRMSKDYERLAESSEAFIYVAMSRLMVKRLARS
jgi:putative transposase